MVADLSRPSLLGKTSPFPADVHYVRSPSFLSRPQPTVPCPASPLSLSSHLLTPAQCMSVTHAPPLGPRAARPQSARSGSSWRTCPWALPLFLIELGALLSAHSSTPLLKPGLPLRMPSSSLTLARLPSSGALPGIVSRRWFPPLILRQYHICNMERRQTDPKECLRNK